MNQENNVFFEKILEPRGSWIIPRMIQNWKIEQYYKELLNTSPSYDMMREMAAFIKIAEVVYFYHNSKRLNSDMPITYTSNGMIYFEFMLSDYKICTVGLKQSSPTITISIKNTDSNEIISSLKFKDRELVIDNKIDEQLFINLLKIMMKSFVNLMRYCRLVQYSN